VDHTGGVLCRIALAAVDSRRMVSIWTTMRRMFRFVYAVPEGKVTDFPFLWSRED